jgi:multiple sugar transport system permease protein
MPHIALVGRRALKTRLLILLIYVVLSLGAVTMVVPFWLMLTSSVTSNVDSHDYRLFPPYLKDDTALYQKFVESAYNEDSKLYATVNVGTEISDFREIKKPADFKEALVQDFDQWKQTLPYEYQITAHGFSVAKPKLSLMGAHLYQKFLAERFNDDIEALNQAYKENREYFDLQTPMEQWQQRVYQPLRERRFDEYAEFRSSLPSWFKMPSPVEGDFVEYITNKYDAKPATFAKRYGDPTIKSLGDLTVAERVPSNPKLAEDWADYVQHQVPYWSVRFDPAAEASWRAYIRDAYKGDLALYHRLHAEDTEAAHVDSLAAVPLPRETPTSMAGLADFGGFLEKAVDLKQVRLDTPEIRYRRFLKEKFGTVAAMNQAYGTKHTSFDRVRFPMAEADWSYMEANKDLVRKDFLVRNYRDVAAYIAVHGRALWVTVILVVASIFLTLTINPLAAYALSRYNLPATYKILLFCLATMAFPAEVTAIPNFLLMKKLHMLNTLWALVLPGAAAGFSIFLLKGFFDSLPQELYEAAEIDGASEFQMFTKICLPMSTPVMAVIGLGAFGFAYGSFMWAFIVCPDRNMWTLMVWLQQMRAWAPQSMIFAALVLASIPPLLVFVFAQNIIMRGVIIPTEK